MLLRTNGLEANQNLMNLSGEAFLGPHLTGLSVLRLKGLYLPVVFWDSNCLVNNRHPQEDISVKSIIPI